MWCRRVQFSDSQPCLGQQGMLALSQAETYTTMRAGNECFPGCGPKLPTEQSLQLKGGLREMLDFMEDLQSCNVYKVFS